MTKAIIIGGVAAGAKAASKLKRLKPDWDVIIYTQDTHVSYSECGLPYYIAGNFADIKKLIIRTPEEFKQRGIEVHLRNQVTKIIPENKQITVKKLDDETEFNVDYDKLIIATGATPFIPLIKNVNKDNVFTLRTLEDGIAIKNKLLQSQQATIIGGGYIGVELLEAFVKQNVETTLIQSNEYIMPLFDPDISHLIQKHILQKDLESVKIISGDYPVEFIGNNKVKRIITNKGKEFKTDMVVIAAGIRPNVLIAKEAGVQLGVSGAIKVNKRMETNIPDIWACGDCVEEHHIVSNAPYWIPLGSTANKEGRCAAINASGDYDEFEGVLGSAVTRYFGFTMSMTGLTETEAIKHGFNAISVKVTKNDKAGYMPDVKSITIKLTADLDTEQILGVQAIGYGDADKRVNSLTGALLSKMTIREFFGNDITYAPPFSTSIDPMLTAAQNLINKILKSKHVQD